MVGERVAQKMEGVIWKWPLESDRDAGGLSFTQIVNDRFFLKKKTTQK